MSIGHRKYALSKAQEKYINRGIIRTYDTIIEDIDIYLRKGEPWSETSMAFLGYLPKRYSHRYDLSFINQFLNIVIAIGYKFNDKEAWWRLNSVIEELAMYAILNEAKACAELDGKLKLINIDELSMYIYYDLDFQLLFDPTMDGIEDDDALTKEIGLVNLSFKNWFKPFAEDFYTLNKYMT